MNTTAVLDDTIFQPSCVPFNPRLRTPYGYEPSLGVAIGFLVLSTTSLALHLFQTVKFRRITSVFFAAAACVECIGWSGRIWSSSCPYDRFPFLMQLLAFTLAPSFVLFGGLLALRLVMLHNTNHPNPFSASIYFPILVTCLAAATALQLIGAILTVLDLRTNGNNGMGPTLSIAGHTLQLYTILIISLSLLLHWLQKAKPNSVFEIGELPVLIATSLSTLTLLINSIYHIAVDIQGWKGPLFTHQGYFIGFEAVLVFIALAVYNIFDPAVMLGALFNHMSTSIETNVVGRRSTAPVIVHQGTTFEIVRPETSKPI